MIGLGPVSQGLGLAVYSIGRDESASQGLGFIGVRVWGLGVRVRVRVRVRAS